MFREYALWPPEYNISQQKLVLAEAMGLVSRIMACAVVGRARCICYMAVCERLPPPCATVEPRLATLRDIVFGQRTAACELDAVRHAWYGSKQASTACTLLWWPGDDLMHSIQHKSTRCMLCGWLLKDHRLGCLAACRLHACSSHADEPCPEHCQS